MNCPPDLRFDDCRKETYHDGWLKKIPHHERRLSVMTPFSKLPKLERAWVSFCVHNRVEPWLEFYENRRSNFSHNPPYRISLTTCLHVSPSIRVNNEQEFVFAITLEDEIVKLGAQTRESMMEWIDALRSKLREMNILQPKDNFYSKEPEGFKSPLRNPNSPLPPTPSPLFQLSSLFGTENREDMSGMQGSRVDVSSVCSMAMSLPSGLSSQGAVSSPHGYGGYSTNNDPNPSPSVISYVRHDYDPQINRRASFRQSLPGSPTSVQSSVVSFVRSPPASRAMPTMEKTSRDHTTIINVPSGHSVFNFDSVSAALDHESMSGSALGFSDTDLLGRSSLRAKSHRVTPGASGATSVTLEGAARPPSPSFSHSITNFSQTDSTHHPLPLGDIYGPHTGFLPGRQRSLVRRRSEHRRSGTRKPGKRSASVGPSLAPRQQQFQVGTDGRLMSLREQQVIRLQKEISHQSGIRLTLRKKDCVNAIALVNCYGQVIVGGWRQRDFPYLHNTFHIGDRLVSVGGVEVFSSAEAQNIIRNEPTAMVEFIIKRIPYGKVFAVKKDSDDQPIGIVRDGNTAVILEVVPGGLASQQGLVPRATAIDGYSSTYWVLTEINHRPLNLFFKHTEIADRLNAVGRDISILVQPLDFIKQIKKQLKLIKNYKEYIVM